jgi:hypothetical protein
MEEQGAPLYPLFISHKGSTFCNNATISEPGNGPERYPQKYSDFTRLASHLWAYVSFSAVLSRYKFVHPLAQLTDNCSIATRPLLLLF